MSARHVPAVVSLGGDRRQCRCSCGWRSVVVYDRRTAVQAWDQHRRADWPVEDGAR